MLNVENLTVAYGSLTIVNKVSFSVREGQWFMLVGPNGAGKSTIVNAVSRGVPYAGSITLAGTDIRSFSPRVFARRLGVLMQNHAVNYAYTVEEVVRLGRYAYAPGALAAGSAGDDEAVMRALNDTGLTECRGQSVLTLSGGELQRTFLAQLFAQDPRLLLLDEPTNHLDPAYQKQMFELLTKWLSKPGRAIVSVVHDLSLAATFGTHALLLDRGNTVACGEMRDVMTETNLTRAYGMDVCEWMRTLTARWNGKEA